MQTKSFFIIIFILISLPKILYAQIESQKINCVILLDKSGSMLKTDPNGLAISATIFLLEQFLMTRDSKVAVISFSNEPEIVGYKPKENRLKLLNIGYIDKILNSSDELKVVPNGNTNLYEALDLARKFLIKEKGRKVIILISDGMPDPRITKKNRNLLLQICGSESLKNNNLLKRNYAEYIKNIYTKVLNKDGIEIYPIAFTENDIVKKYLSALKIKTVGDPNIIVANRKNLLEKLMNFSIDDYQYVKIVKKIISKGKRDRISYSIKLSKLTQKARFLIYYKTPPIGKIRVRVLFNSHVIFDSKEASVEREKYLYIESRDREKSLVFQSIIINRIREGTYTLQLISEKAFIPEAILLIDSQMDITPDFEIAPPNPRANQMVRVAFGVVHNGKFLKLQDVFMRASYKEPQNIEYFKNNTLAVASFIFDSPGKYILHVKFKFLYKDINYPLIGSCKKEIQINPPVSLIENVWISRRKIKEKIKTVINLPPLGEKTKVIYPLAVRTTINGKFPKLHLETSTFVHKTEGIVLETGGKNWVYVKPSNVIVLTPKRPFYFDLIAEIPQSYVPNNIPDGIYEGKLKLMAGGIIIDEVPVNLKVSIPHFIFLNKNNSEIYKVVKTIFYPGNETHYFKIPVWTTALNGVKAKIFLEDYRGIEITEKREWGRVEGIRYKVKNPVIEVPNKKSNPAYIYVGVKLLDNCLNNKTFANRLFISGNKHREAELLLITHVNFIPLKWKWPIVGSLFLLSIFCIWIGWRKFSYRKFWINREIEYSFISEHSTVEELRINNELILKIEYNGKELPLTEENEHIKVSNPDGIEWRRAEEVEEKEFYEGDEVTECYPSVNDELFVSTSQGEFCMKVKRIPTFGNPVFRIEIVKSPYGRGRSSHLLFVLGISFLGLTITFLLNFYLPFKIIGKLLEI